MFSFFTVEFKAPVPCILGKEQSLYALFTLDVWT